MLRSKVFCSLILVLAVLLVAGPAFGGVRSISSEAATSIPPGYDYWETLGSGATSYSFENDPLPAGFFCEGSAPFTGVLEFEGVPVETAPAKALGTTDTIIERLDTATFDAHGWASTRIQVRALSLEGASPVETTCGTWKVSAALTGEQPITHMVLHREHEFGGQFKADIRLQVQVDFANAEGDLRSVNRVINLPTAGPAPFGLGTIVKPACAKPIDHTLPVAGPQPAIRLLDSGLKSVSVEAGDPTVLRQIDTTPQTDLDAGCICNRQGVCRKTYVWHHEIFGCLPDFSDCEHHFTLPPCNSVQECQELLDRYCIRDSDGGYVCEQVVNEGLMVELQELYNQGLIDEEPEATLKRRLNKIRALIED